MKTLFILIIISMTIPSRHGSCFNNLFEIEIKDGSPVIPDGCIDPKDGSKHPLASEWNTGDCLRCKCSREGLSCCTRYGGTAAVDTPGCKAVVDPDTCTYVNRKTDNLSAPCD